jgi:hypothetical protein
MSEVPKQKTPWLPRWEYLASPEYLKIKQERKILSQKKEIFLEEEKNRQTEDLDVVSKYLASKTTRSVEEIRHKLQVLGFNQTVYRKEVIFAFALRCEKRFRYLAEQFPNLKGIFDSLFFAVEMGRLNETTSGQIFTTARLKEPEGALERVNLQNWIKETLSL